MRRRDTTRTGAARRRRPLATAVAAALLFSGVPLLSITAALPAHAATAADGSSGDPAPAAPQAPPSPLSPAMLATGTGLSASQQQAVADASAQATSSGQPVSVDSLTTSISTLTAEPNGQLSWSSSVMPQRVQKNGAWADIDTTLKQNASGTYAPAAAPGSLVLSGGGSGPLVTIADSAGRDVSLYWPSALPTPTVSGSTLTYPSVFPDVDLQVSATPTGGITDVLVVKTAAAASNPALSSLKLTTHTQA